jgi:general secretion pathway protein B
MSLILEALRKSEQQRRLGETPTLATDSAWAARRWRGEPTRAARWPWIVLAVLLAAGGTAAWWLLAPRAGAPEGASTANAVDAAPTAPAGDTGPVAAVAAPQAQPAPAATITAPPPPAAAPPAAVATAAPTAAQPIDPSIRLEVPTPSPDGEYPEVPAPAEQAAATLMPSPTGPATAPSADTSAQVPTAPAIAPPPVATTAPATAPEPAPTPAPVAATPATEATSSSDVPPVYALSLAIRQALPPLRLSMHVWNADPARRFVILGEARAVEGEAAGDDLRVVEIRRDGVVLEFRGTRFLLPRGGY